ncbi:nicotinamide riboside transporter PnuC [Acetobacter sp. TBRC 12305]|uniref:Nicotinamide riboside transporter PnuC n=1 Tax=Acetobacter garciniae TaxID=2817435 RepID=A0A939HMH7_9PROT|nr:nicotinamide riboside transporter PnuC [Acetobacter garciniae]MBO1323611.1 nicotinamide mononucleotide transporter [Acetobacter garciniae]MBX0343300.1 nicotinamide riboside transporter PnuC [Acetobacter garciniae]
MSLTEWVAAIASALGVWLAGRRMLSGWVVTVVASGLYGVVFARARLYADTALQVVFALTALYGLWCWWRGGRHASARRLPVVRPAPFVLWRDGAVAGACGLLLAWALRQWSDDAVPLADAMLSAYSILGQVWTARRFRACWLLWIGVDALYTALFVERALYVTATLYAGFVLLAVWGWRQWGDDAPEDAKNRNE